LRSYIEDHPVAFFESKRKQDTMKIKKSELLALIKEEIMGEMDGLTMMDDPYDDAAVPDTMQRGGAMDQVAQEMEQMITVEMDDVISIISNYLVTQDSAGAPQKAAMRGMAMLRDAGFRAPDPSTIEQMISPEMGDEEPMMQEGFENITPENLAIVGDVVKKMAPLLGAMTLPTLMLAIHNAFKAQAGTAEQDRGAIEQDRGAM